MKLTSKFILAFFLILLTQSGYAGELNIPHSFTSGAKAVAAEVNDNFTAVETEVSDNHSRIAALESALTALQQTVTQLQTNLTNADDEITSLQTEVTDLNDLIATLDSSSLNNRVIQLESNPILALKDFIQLRQTDPQRPVVEFRNANVQITNGLGITNATNGLGNLIIGYNEEPAGYLAEDRVGSHNLVLGREHRYASYTGLIAGRGNTINGAESSITAGSNINLGTAQWSAINMTADTNNISIVNPVNIDIEAGGSIDFQSGNNFLLDVGKSINIAAAQNFIVNSTDTAINNNQNFVLTSGKSLSLQSAEEIDILAGTNASISANSQNSFISGSTTSIISGNNMLIQTDNDMAIQASGTIVMTPTP